MWYPISETIISLFLGIIKTASIIEGPKIIMKFEIPIMSWVMSEKVRNKESSAKKCSIVKWKWFTQDHVAWGMQ